MGTIQLRATISIVRHGDAGESLGDLGKEQVAATRDTHFKNTTIHGLFSSPLRRAIESAAILNVGRSPEFRGEHEDVGNKWRNKDVFFAGCNMPSPDPTRVDVLLREYPPAVANRVVLRRLIQELLGKLFYMDSPDGPIRCDEPRHLVLVSHRYCGETAVENPGDIPLLEYGDVVRFEATATIDPASPPVTLRFFFQDATYLPCPIRE